MKAFCFKFLLIIPVLICLLPLYASAKESSSGKSDSLEGTLIQAQTDSARIWALSKISWYYMYMNTDSALVYAKRAYALSITPHEKIKSESTLGFAYGVIGDYEKAIQYTHSAYQYAQQIHAIPYYANLLSEIGSNYYKLNDRDNAYKYFIKSLDACSSNNEKWVPLINIARIYVDKKDYKRAYEYYLKALKVGEETNNTNDIAITYNRLGELFLYKNEYKQSLEYYRKSLKMLRTDDYYHITVCLKSIAEIYRKTGNYSKGIQTALEADSTAEISGFLFALSDTRLLLSQLYEDSGQADKAFNFYKQYAMVKDSAFNIDKNKRINYLQTEFEAQKKELEIENLKQKSTYRQRITYICIIISVLISIVMIVIISKIRKKNRRLKHEKALTIERLKIEQEKAQIEYALLIQQKEHEKLESQRLELILEEKHREILTHTIQIDKHKEVLTSIQSKMNDIIKTKDSDTAIQSVKQLASEIQNQINKGDNWEQVKLHFEKVHPEFFNNLTSEFPNLTPHELKLCALTKLQFSSKEIGILLNIVPETVQMSRYRLKKKMNLPENINFIDFICARN